MTVCRAPGCDNPVPRRARGRPAVYCSPACRPARRRRGVVVEVDHPESSPDGRPTERVWRVRLRRGERVVVVAEALGWPSAHALAGELHDLLSLGPTRKGGAID